jgi:ketosteroid isomerase-like protein
MSQENEKIVLEVFSVIEHRDRQRPDPRPLIDLCDSEIEFHWPASLPYGGPRRGFTASGPSWEQVWSPLQPTEAERRMDPRVVASNGNEVVVLWRQRGVSRAGDRFEGEVLGLYEVRGHKLARAQMFYFDTVALANFLGRANGTLRSWF